VGEKDNWICLGLNPKTDAGKVSILPLIWNKMMLYCMSVKGCEHFTFPEHSYMLCSTVNVFFCRNNALDKISTMDIFTLKI
jgi:hypothetical protein